MAWPRTLMKRLFPLQNNTLYETRDYRCKGILLTGAKVSLPIIIVTPQHPSELRDLQREESMIEAEHDSAARP